MAGCAEIFLSEESVNRTGQNARHEAAVRVHPFGVAVFDDSITDEARARRAHRDEFVRIHGQIGGGLRWLGRATLDEVSRHPIILAAGEIFYGLAKNVPMQFHPTFAGGTDQAHGNSWFKGFRYDRSLAVAGKSPDADFFRLRHGLRIGFEIIDQLADAPLPRAQRTPIVRLAWLAFIHQADDARGQG